MTAAVSNLRNDPSLRFTENGRLLLRLLDLHLARMGQLRELPDSVPPHRTDLVADLAGNCAQVWEDFAAQLRRRHETSA